MIVLQHNKVYYKRVQWLELYCNTTDCIAMGVQWLELYCNITNCIAILVLYCDLKGFFLYCNTHGVLWLRRDLRLRIVLQYNYCIAT